MKIAKLTFTGVLSYNKVVREVLKLEGVLDSIITIEEQIVIIFDKEVIHQKEIEQTVRDLDNSEICYNGLVYYSR